ncbi:MAG TPA: hypothetical protein VGH32_13855, partial [Pirellulales bacterium]
EEFAFGGPQTAESMTSAVAPYMIGDFFLCNGQIIFVAKGAAAGLGTFQAPIPCAAGRAKISDDNCVLPVDRVSFLGDHFDNAIQLTTPTVHALDVNRYTPGFEKTFLDGNASLELRIPFADTQNSDLFLDNSGREEATEFGDMVLVLKALAYRDATVAFGGGVGFVLPTAPDARIFTDGQSQPLFTIDNSAFHLQPFLALLYTPSDRLFFQTFIEFDLDTTGNHVEQLDVGRIGTLHDQDLFQADLQLGYWWYRDPTARYLTGVAPTMEYHYTTTIQNASIVTAGARNGDFIFGSPANRLDIHNLTLGVELQIGPRALLNIAAVLPLNGNNDNRQFDSEYFIQFNRFF